MTFGLGALEKLGQWYGLTCGSEVQLKAEAMKIFGQLPKNPWHSAKGVFFPVDFLCCIGAPAVIFHKPLVRARWKINSSSNKPAVAVSEQPDISELTEN